MAVGAATAGMARSSTFPGLWPAGAAGAVSLTYDDGLDSQLDVAVPQLDAMRMRATFFVTLDNLGNRRAEWARLTTRGHELADHSISHPCDLRGFSPARYAAREIVPTEKWLDAYAGPHRIPTFAYPCDVTDLGRGSPNDQAHRFARLLARNGIIAARTSEGAPNNPATAIRRPYRLQALAVGYDATDAQSIADYLATAARRGHWAILVFHQIGSGIGPGNISPALHAAVLDQIAALPLWCAPMGEIFLHIRDSG